MQEIKKNCLLVAKDNNEEPRFYIVYAIEAGVAYCKDMYGNKAEFAEDEIDKICEHKGYKLIFRRDGRFQTSISRPYDDADYYWALTDDLKNWDIILDCKKREVFTGSFEQAVDRIAELNKAIAPKIIHN